MAIKIRFPILQRLFGTISLREILILVELPTKNNWKQYPFLLDTGTQFTTIAKPVSEELGMEVPTSRPVGIRGTAGTTSGYLTQYYFSILGLPSLKFRTHLCVSNGPLKMSLLSLTDLVSYFTFRTLPPTRLHRFGSFQLTLLPNHRGETRTNP